jgi:dTDP-4-amino-4,6-dideoxygalactose transaminase
MADMDPIQALAGRYRLMVIEDACQAHGAEYFSRKANRWFKAGSMGQAAAFSFYPGKNLGACGEAGAVTTNDAEIDRKVRMLRDHGQLQKYYHEIEGYNGRLDAVQAGILKVKLRYLNAWNESRREAAQRYTQALTSESVAVPWEPSRVKAVYHLYVIRVSNRDQLQRQLTEAQIGTGIHYPIPLHLQKAYAKLGYTEGHLAVSERTAAEILSLPMYPNLEAAAQNRVAQRVLDYASLKVARAAGAGMLF